jgi:hypothetical protein
MTAELPPASPADVAYLQAVMDDPAGDDDAMAVARLAWSAFGHDYASLGAFVSYCEAQTRALIRSAERGIRALGAQLALSGTMSAEAVAAVLESA